MSISKSGVRSGAGTDVDGPRSPPKSPSPRAKIERFTVHSRLPAGSVTVVSFRMTAALPLSQISVMRVTERAEPFGGSGAGMRTASLACKTRLNSISIPGKLTFGASVMWKVAATLLNVGSTCGVLSVR
jgi:hypothetical protein